MARLTDASIRALPLPESGVCVHFDDSVPGFGVRCSQGGSKSFVLTFGADRRRVTIGRYPLVGLSDARTAAKRLLAEHTLGKHRAPRITYSDALQIYLDDRAQRNRARTMKDTKRILNRYFDSITAKNVEDITTHHLTKITDALAKTTPGTARHAFSEARTFFKWCTKRRYIVHSPLEGLEPPAPARARERVLSDDELRAVWTAAEKMGGMFGRIVQLLALTGQRRGEIASLQAEWIRGDSITLPASICKNKRPHTFPIGTLTKSIVQPCSFNGFSKAKAQLDKLAQIEPWTLHDLRRTYATNLQRRGIRLEVIEALLNHVSGTRAGIVGVYNRHRYEQEMREAVTTYEQWFERTIMSRNEAE